VAAQAFEKTLVPPIDRAAADLPVKPEDDGEGGPGDDGEGGQGDAGDDDVGGQGDDGEGEPGAIMRTAAPAQNGDEKTSPLRSGGKVQNGVLRSRILPRTRGS